MHRGGAERQLVILATGLRQLGHQVSVAVFYGGGPLEADLLEAGVVVRVIGKNGRWDVASFAARLLRIVREERPDVLHGYLADPNILTVLLRPLLPSTRIVWGVRGSGRDLERYDRFVRLAFRVQCFLSRFADLIVANSHAGRSDHVARGFPPGRTTVIPNGIDSSRFRRDERERKRVRAEFGMCEGEKLVGVVARLDPMKDHATFLRAAGLISREMPEVRFVCVGNGPPDKLARLQSLAGELAISGRLIWSPGRSDVAAVYNALDLLVSSSCWGEGFSNVIGEAMSCETPCAVTDAGDSALIVGDTGRVAPAGNPAVLASGILSLLAETPEERLERGRRARARIVSEYSVALLVERTERALLGLLPEGARSTA